MRKGRSLHFVAGTSALMLLAGCGGGPGAFAPGPRAYTVVGGAEGPAMDLLQRGAAVDFAPLNANVGSAQAIVLDGDHITPGLLGGISGLKSAVLKGAPLILLDADERLKDAVVEAIGAPGSTGGTSRAIAFARLGRGGEHDFRICELSDAPMRVESSEVQIRDGAVSNGPVLVGSQARTLSALRVRAMLDAVGSAANDAPRIPVPPVQIKSFYAEYVDKEGGVPNDSLNGQIDSCTATTCYRGLLDQPDRGVYQQILIELVDGVSDTGAQTRDLFDVETATLHYGWTQSAIFTSTKFDTESSLHERLEPAAASCFHSRKDGERWVDNPYTIDYIDASGESDTWGGEILENDLDLHGWDVTATDRDPAFDVLYTYRQTGPFDGIQENYDYAWNVTSNDHWQHFPYPAASIGPKRVFRSSSYGFYPPVKGQVNLYTTLTRRFVDAYVRFGTPWPQGAGRKDLDGGSARQRRLRFDLIRPPT